MHVTTISGVGFHYFCSSFNFGKAIQQYAHGLLLESQFVPSSIDRWAVRAKIRQKRPSRWP